MNNNYLHAIRDWELDQALLFFPSPSNKNDRVKVLDFGAGTGRQSARLHLLGYEVLAVDLPSSAYAHERVYPILDYNGYKLPLPNDSIDLVFSSNVLEHVSDIKIILDEIKRVLTPNGIMIHILPTPSWRWWSILSHYPWIIKKILQRLQGKRYPSSKSRRDQPPTNIFHYLYSIAWPSRHGQRGTTLTECWYYSENWWKKTFRTSGFEVIKTRPNQLFYTDSMLFGEHLPLKTRINLSKWLGSSCRIFVLVTKNCTPLMSLNDVKKTGFTTQNDK